MKRLILKKSIGLVLFLILLGVVAGAICPAPPAPEGITLVSMRNIAFVPSVVTIQVGDTVRWVNEDIVPHTTTSAIPGAINAGELWDSPLLFAGQSFDHKFTQPGDFVYFCRVHPTIMRDAHVIVEAVEAAEGEGEVEEAPIGEEGEPAEGG